MNQYVTGAVIKRLREKKHDTITVSRATFGKC